MNFYVPEGYVPKIGLRETQAAIKTIKDFFQRGADQTAPSHPRIGASFCDAGIGAQRQSERRGASGGL